ncbi:MAG: hypothetical protein PHO15_03645 [Eubacteriales bacterium]|nr:hypothetical protein [Eubacteriales bacterium]
MTTAEAIEVLTRRTENNIGYLEVGDDDPDICALCKEENEAYKLSIDALRKHAARENPAPLTLEQLRERIKPVWCVCKLFDGNNGYYCLCQNGMITPPSHMSFYAEERPSWIFYDHPPKGATS